MADAAQTQKIGFWTAVNIVAWHGWTALATRLCMAVFQEGARSIWELPEVVSATIVLEAVCIVEVGRIVFGGLKGNLSLGIGLHLTRAFVIFAIFPCLKDHMACPVVLFAWAFTEICRYPLYIFGGSLVSKLRYVVPVITFPLGAGGEAWGMYAALPQLEGFFRYQAMFHIAVNVIGGLCVYPGLVKKGARSLGLLGEGKSKKT
eukprot:CAMPEP_0176082014 /NCGR_PEP_ID=MMETSP0120_2-20121206/41024_1 /TAXON_ID=160619 /ORGANISM="Kryptoperidinium foliaceum, Strain CCMP 1326" /LENGTH=203 /DNA_ID=CAMNT_0017415781 /DNA_START=47 /DNA_END=658 /DNA_ORIENTATION=+